MTRLSPRVSTLHTLNIAYQDPQETLQGTPTTLPMSEPETPQISYTVASGDLATFTGFTPANNIWIALIFAAGKVVTTATISWRMKRNGINVATGTQIVAANTYYTIIAGFCNGLGAGSSGVFVDDVLTIYLWSSQADSNWDYNAYMIQPSRVQPSTTKFKQSVYLITYIISTGYPALTLGNPFTATSTQQINVYVSSTAFAGLNATKTVNCLNLISPYYLFRTYTGDYAPQDSAVIYTHVSYRPYYRKNFLPSSISWRYLYGLTV